MAYISRHASGKRSTLSAEFVYLLVVLAAGVATAWWAGHKVGADLSAISTIASVLGITERTGLTRPVGYSLTTADHQVTAPYCNSGQAPAFSPGLTGLKQQIGNAMGTPVECEHVATQGGDMIQATTTGLASYSKATNTFTFTDGWRHWAIAPNGFVTWEGTQSDPPAG
jgi:hypothetical protein